MCRLRWGRRESLVRRRGVELFALRVYMVFFIFFSLGWLEKNKDGVSIYCMCSRISSLFLFLSLNARNCHAEETFRPCINHYFSSILTWLLQEKVCCLCRWPQVPTTAIALPMPTVHSSMPPSNSQIITGQT